MEILATSMKFFIGEKNFEIHKSYHSATWLHHEYLQSI